MPAARGRPPKSDQSRREQRLAVSREAVRLFRSAGVGEVSGREIAQASGISERTLWRLFRTKEACVEPVLSVVVEAGAEALRSWPDGVFLDDYLTDVTAGIPADDLDAALGVVRMSHASPALRAVWLLLQERNELVLGEVLAARAGLPPGSPEIQVQAAAVNAALRLIVDDTAAGGGSDERSRRLVAALRQVSRVVEGT